MPDVCEWTGASTKKYLYSVFKLPISFNSNQDGNYIYARLDTEQNCWIPLYIGQGCLSDRCSDQHDRAKEIASKGATHVRAHLNPDEAARKNEESDLLASFPQAYAPIGCNVKIGG